MNSRLTKQVLLCQGKSEIPESVVQSCIAFVYYNLRKTCPAEEDQWADYAAASLPRIRRAIRSFSYQGKDFEAYLTTCIRYHYKTYLRNNRKRKGELLTISAFHGDCEGYSEMPAPEPAKDIPKMNAREPISCITKLCTLHRRVVIYVLMNSYCVGERFLALLAKHIDFSFEWLLRKRNEVLALLQSARDLRTELNDQCSALLERLHGIQRQAKYVAEEHRELEPRIRSEEAFIRRRLRGTNQRLRSIRLCPQHRQLADIVGVPKGTVDSSMYYLRHNWEKARNLLEDILAEL